MKRSEGGREKCACLREDLGGREVKVEGIEECVCWGGGGGGRGRKECAEGVFSRPDVLLCCWHPVNSIVQTLGRVGPSNLASPPHQQLSDIAQLPSDRWLCNIIKEQEIAALISRLHIFIHYLQTILLISNMEISL